MPVSNDSIFVNAKYTEIYYRIGTFEDRSNRVKMVKAPFALLQLPNNMYIEPCGFGADTRFSQAGPGYDGRQLGQDMGWFDGSSMVLETNEMGDQRDGWRGMFTIGNV
jgi:hypothetical protein